jgi:hypothetical protein
MVIEDALNLLMGAERVIEMHGTTTRDHEDMPYTVFHCYLRYVIR